MLYEVLTGRPAFRGETASDVIVAILDREPDWSALPADLPSAIRRLLRRCLQKDPKRRLRDIADAAIELDELDPASSAPSAIAASRLPWRALAWLTAGIVLASVAFAAWWRVGAARTTVPARNIQFQRLTDFVGIEDSPAMSPDGKMVAFAAHEKGKRHVWIRLLAGGAPLKLTADDVDANWPRWAPDSSAILYHVSASTPGEEGTLWEIPALGGSPRRITSALGGGDISHDGTRVAAFQVHGGKTELMIVSRDGSVASRVAQVTASTINMSPRWSPDDRWIAFQTIRLNFDAHIEVVAAAGGAPRTVARSSDLRGLSWLPDGTGLVFSSSQGSTLPYPPTFSLRVVALDGTGERQVTFGDFSYRDPDVHKSGALVASQLRNQSDVWRFPVDGSPAENVGRAVRITRQTGAAQTPSLSPDGSEIVYLSDSGGHGNLWVARTDGSGVRQITFERDADRTVGVPVWSPTSGTIAFIFTSGGTPEQWLVNRDGSGLRRLTPGIWAYWSPDGRWLYVAVERAGRYCIEKVPVDGGAAVPVRCDAVAAALSPDGATLYFVKPLVGVSGGWQDMELSKARPETGPATVLTRLSGSRIPFDPSNMHTIVSPDGRWLALPLTDGTTSNLWALPADGGNLRPLTDFVDRAVMIVRRISWTADSRSIYAAVADIDSDVVRFDGLLR